MQSPDDYDYDDPKHQADLDGIIERLLARRRVDRSRHDDPLTIMLDRISDPFKRIEKPSEEPIKQIEKPLPEALPAASTVEELRANLGRRKRGGRKVQPLSDKPTMDLELIEKLFNEGTPIHQIRAALHVGSARLRFEILAFLPYIAETERRGRKSRLPTAIEEEQVKRLRARGWGWKKIAAELKACHKRLMRRYGEPSTSS